MDLHSVLNQNVPTHVSKIQNQRVQAADHLPALNLLGGKLHLEYYPALALYQGPLFPEMMQHEQQNHLYDFQYPHDD